MTILEKYIWVINALYNRGEHGLSLKELNDRWIRDINVSNGEPLHRQTFDRWKGNILMAFINSMYARCLSILRKRNCMLVMLMPILN